MLHAFATYLDAQLPGAGGAGAGGAGAGGAGAGAFSARHVSAAPAPPPRGPRALVVHRVARAPPHYVLIRGEETVEVSDPRRPELPRICPNLEDVQSLEFIFIDPHYYIIHVSFIGYLISFCV